MKSYDAIVLGTGGVGSAALYELARRGVRALGIDRFAPPHDRGSTHGQTRVFRQVYFEHADYVPLLVDAHRLWRELEQYAGRQLLHECGALQMGPADGEVVPGVLQAAAEHQLPVEELAPDQIERRWPGLRVPRDLVGVLESQAGFLLVEDCVEAQLKAAQAAGAELLTDVEVLGWTADNGEVRVRTNGGEFQAQRLVITAGAWAGQLLTDLELDLTVRRKSLFWFDAPSGHYDVASGFPVFLFEMPHGIFYGFPKLDSRGVKFAEHTGGRAVDDPLSVDRSVDAEEQRLLVDVLAAHLPEVSPRVAEHVVCLYTMTPDENFIIDKHPAHANVVFAAGLSGHGFKFASVLGRVLVDLALDGASELPIGFLSLSRWS